MPDVNFTSAAQMRAAFILAGGHGHEWAGVECLDPEAFEGIEVAEAVQCIHMLVDLQREADGTVWGGIASPEWDVDGDIVHTTMTGRLSWLVDVTGRVVLTVWRPGDVMALRVVVEADGSVGPVEVTDACRWRHLVAAGNCVHPLVGEPCPWLAHFPQEVVMQVFAAEQADLQVRAAELAAASGDVTEEASGLAAEAFHMAEALEALESFLSSGL